MVEKEQVARQLGATSYSLDPGITHIFSVRAAPEVEALPTTPIKLLEVSTDTIPAGIMPLHFGPMLSRGIVYPYIIIQVTPAEFEQIKAQDLKLPDGWKVGQELPRPADSDGGNGWLPLRSGPRATPAKRTPT